MNLKELKSRIVFITMLISMILTFLGLINNSISNVDTGVILLIHIILSLLNNVFMYQIFKKSEKKEYIKKLVLFYAIVFVVSALDLFLKETRYGASIGSYFGGIIYLDFQFILTLFLENILTIIHINAYKTNGGGGAKNFIINLLMYELKHYLLSIIPVFMFYFIYKTIVESDGMHYVYFSDYIVILLGFSILSVIATVNYLLTCFNEFVLIKRNIKITNVGILLAIFLALPINYYQTKIDNMKKNNQDTDFNMSSKYEVYESRLNNLKDGVYADSDKIHFKDKIKIGKYEQDGNVKNGKEDIEWVAVKKYNGYYLLMADKVLDAIDVSTEISINDYQDSVLYSFSNYDFLNEAFNDYEKSILKVVKTYSDTGNISEKDMQKANSEEDLLKLLNDYD